MNKTSIWIRDGNATARRGKQVLQAESGHWVLSAEGETTKVVGSCSLLGMEAAIIEADSIRPPEGWEAFGAGWISGPWHVCVATHAGKDCWAVFRSRNGEIEEATRQTFASPDRARFWAETRFDRSDLNLRGPMPRAGTRSSAKLPDVRVTPDEREEALALTKRLGLSYSQFARAAVWFAKEYIEKSGAFVVIKGENSVVRFEEADVTG